MTRVHALELKPLPTIGEWSIPRRVVQNDRVSLSGAFVLPRSLIQIDRDDATDAIGEPVENRLMPGADAQKRCILAERAEAAATIQQLRELVTLSVHRELVVAEAKASQYPEPFVVV